MLPARRPPVAFASLGYYFVCMHENASSRHFVIACVLIASTTLVTAQESELESSLKEGTYQAGDAQRFGSGTQLRFEYHIKQRHIVGISSNMSGTLCYEGKLEGNTIRTTNVVNIERDRTTRALSFSPLRESQFGDYDVLQPTLPLSPFPNHRGFALPKHIMERLTNDIRECAKHFDEPDIPAACGDPNLRFTDQSEDPIDPKYFHSGVACQTRETPACTAANVFQVLLETPEAVAPVTIAPRQQVKDCGMLWLLGKNEIKTVIDADRHMITNYTLPGHEFYLGSVIRYVVQVGDRVDINTEGRGTENKLWTWINVKAAPPIWDHANAALRKAFFAKHASSKPRARK